MTTEPLAEGQQGSSPGDGAHDPIAVPLSLLLWALVVLALAYGVISTLQKVTALFS
jgi:hypothetical protein